jgi:hypothetical protein
MGLIDLFVVFMGVVPFIGLGYAIAAQERSTRSSRKRIKYLGVASNRSIYDLDKYETLSVYPKESRFEHYMNVLDKQCPLQK